MLLLCAYTALTAKSYCSNHKHVSGKSTAKDQRTSESIGLCKSPLMECIAGRVAAEAPKGSKQTFLGGALIDWSQVSTVPSGFGMAIDIDLFLG